MKTASLAAFAFIALAGPTLAQAQSEHRHHPGGAPAPESQAQPQAPSTPAQPQGQMPMMGRTMQSMPEQCRAVMQAMPQSCADAMQQAIQGMAGGGTHGHGTQASPSQTGAQSQAAKAYVEAMDKMHGPMMQGIQDPDPDVAFVKGMIPHHQSAIDMAKVVLQHGRDEQTKKWANDVIREQQREIDEMQEWLKAKGKL
jgi:uncharacterized protein (DUF305 family)